MIKNSKENKKINIVMLLDDNYFFCTYVALKSMKINKDANAIYNIYILIDGVSQDNQQKIQLLNEENFITKIIDIQEYCQKYKNIQNVYHISNTALVKFDIPNILPHLDKALYLDGDILATKDLSELFNIDIDNFYLGAVRELRSEYTRKYNELTNTKYYFNSGVMLLNLKKMRKDDLPQKLLITKLNQPKSWRCMDQDVFNNVVNDNFKHLPIQYNNFISLFIADRINIKQLNTFYKTKFTSFKELCKNSTILHFACNLKPWIYDLGYLSKIYQEYSNVRLKLKRLTSNNKFIENIFSIRNSYNKSHKVITIIGIKLKIKRKKTNSLLHINKNKLTKEMQKNTGYGLSEHDRNPQLIVSLTSFPQRMKDIHYCLHSLLCQTLKPNKLILWLAEEQFPNKEKDLPKKVLKLKQRGLSIEWCKDTKSYKKLIPALKKYPDDIIVTADDDIYYPNDWLEKLYNAYLDDNQSIHSHRVHKITFDFDKNINSYTKWEQCIKYQNKSFLNFSTGSGGILYPPHCLYKDILDETLFLKLVPNADDIWFWAMAVLNGTQTHIVKNNMEELVYINPERELGLTNEITLFKKNGIDGGNDTQIRNLIKYYPQIMEKLLNE